MNRLILWIETLFNTDTGANISLGAIGGMDVILADQLGGGGITLQPVIKKKKNFKNLKRFFLSTAFPLTNVILLPVFLFSQFISSILLSLLLSNKTYGISVSHITVAVKCADKGTLFLSLFCSFKPGVRFSKDPKLYGPEKPFLKLRPAYSVKLVF